MKRRKRKPRYQIIDRAPSADNGKSLLIVFKSRAERARFVKRG